MAFRPQLLSGARGELAVNGIVLAYVTDVTVNVNSAVRAAHTFGSPSARSLEPLSTGCTVSIGRVIPVNSPAGQAVNTSAIQSGLEKVITQMLSAEDVSITLKDKITQATIANVVNCRFTNRSLGMAASQLANERIQMVGIYDAANGNVAEKLGLD